jgi:hypothetical protein
MDFCWKSQRLGESLKTFGAGIFFLRFLKIHRLVWIFLWIFLAVSNLFHQCHFCSVQIFTLLNVAPPPLLLALPDSVGNLWPFSLLPPRVQKKNTHKKLNLGLKYMYYNVNCTFVGMYTSGFKFFLSKMFCYVFWNLWI